MQQSRITYIDGIRGMASLIVVFYHYLLSFYPGFFVFKPAYFHTNSNIEQTIAVTPLNIFYNSGFAVCLFFVISGYALSYKYFVTRNQEYLRSSALRRYFRLMIPTLFSVLISYLILKAEFYTNIYTAVNYTKSTFWFSHLWNMDANFTEMLKEGLFTSLFSGGTISYNPVLWTIYIEFIGSMIVFAVLALFGNFPKRFLVYGLIIIVWNGDYIPAFITGLALCDYYTSQKRKPIFEGIVFLLFLLAVYISSYQSFVGVGSIWKPLDFISSFNKSFPFIIGAALFVFVTINSSWLKRFFSSFILQFLGKISFSLYLIHLLLIGSLACFLFDYFFAGLHLSYNVSFALMFLLSLSATFSLSFIVYKYIDLPGMKLSKWIYRKVFTHPPAPSL